MTALPSPIENKSATVSTIISTIEQLEQLKKAGQTSWVSKITQAFESIKFDLKYGKNIEIARVDGEKFQDDFNQIHATKTLSLIFEDQIDQVNESDSFERKAEKYDADYRQMINIVSFPYDVDEDGAVSESEEKIKPRSGFSL